MLLHLFLVLVDPHLLILAILPWTTRSGRNEMQEVLMADQITMLVNDSNGYHEVPCVDWMEDSTHDIEPLSLGNDIIIIELSCSLVVVLELTLIVLSCEETSLDHILVLLATLRDDELLSIFFEFFLNFIDDALNEGFFHLAVDSVVVLTENALDLFPVATPLTLLTAVAALRPVNREDSLDFLSDSFPFSIASRLVSCKL